MKLIETYVWVAVLTALLKQSVEPLNVQYYCTYIRALKIYLKVIGLAQTAILTGLGSDLRVLVITNQMDTLTIKRPTGVNREVLLGLRRVYYYDGA